VTQACISRVTAKKSCTHCKENKVLSEFYTTGKLKSGLPKYNSWCKVCISNKQASYHKRVWGADKLQYTAFKRTKTARSYLQYLRSKAAQRRKNEEIISLDALELIWLFQKGTCAVTGWPMTMELANGVVQTNCSIDRIDSSYGYAAGNVQLVCRIANVAKTSLSKIDFLALCKAVVENQHG
jgi:hypothetical protein